MQSKSQVVVELETGAVPGLVLKVSPDGEKVLVTYEEGGKVATAWMARAQVRLPA